MAKKIIGFEIDIKGSPSTVRAIQDLKKQLLEVQKGIKDSTSSTELEALQAEYVRLTANVKALNEEQTKQVRDFKAAAQGGEGSLQGLKNRVSDLKKEYAALSEEQRKGAQGQAIIDEQVKLQTVINSVSADIRRQTRDFKAAQEGGTGSIAQLRNRLSDLNRQYDNLSKAAREADLGKALKQDIADLTKELKGLEGETGRFQRNVGNYPRLVKQFVRGAIPGFEAFQGVLEGAGVSAGRLNTILSAGFGLFQVAALLVKAGKAFIDFTKEVDAARASVASFTGAAGEELNELTARSQAVAKQFGKDTKEVIQSAKDLADTLGVSYTEALDLIEKGFVSGLDANGEFLSSIKGNEAALRDLAEATDEFSVRQRAGLESQKELSRAQIEVAARFADSGNDLQIFANKFQTFVINTFLDFLDLLQPLFNIFRQLGAALTTIGKAFGFFGDETAEAQSRASGINKILEFQIAIGTAVIGVIASIVSSLAEFVDKSDFVKSAASGISQAFTFLIDTILKVPSVLSGVLASIRQFFANAFGTASSTEDVEARIRDLRAQGFTEAEIQAQISKSAQDGRSVGEAFSEAYNASIAAGQAETQKVVEQGNKRQIVETEEAAEARLEAEKKAQERFKKLAEERVKFQEELRKREQANLGLLLELQRRLTDAQIAAIEDETEQRLALSREAAKRREEDTRASFERLRAETIRQEAEIVAIFGAKSKEALAFRKQADAELGDAFLATQKVINAERAAALEEQRLIEEQSNAALIEADRQAALERAAALRQAYDNDLNALGRALTLEELIIEERRARGLVSAKEAAEQETKARIDNIKKQLERVAQAEATFGASDAILAKRQELNTALAKLEEAQTAKVIQEAQKQAEARAKAFQNVGQSVSSGLQSFDAFAEGLSQRETKRLEQAQNGIVTLRSELEAQLENATGLEKRFLEERIKANIAAEGSIVQQKERTAQDAARRSKAVAVAQSVINGILSVSSALAVPPGPPFTIPNAVLAGTLAAAETAALIAAPAFADGGRVGRANIPKQPNGDNVLATVKTNEVVLNQKQQQALGGARTFARIGVPGFARGGLVGTRIEPPIITNANSTEAFGQLIKQLGDRRVVLVAEDVYRDREDLDNATSVRILG